MNFFFFNWTIPKNQRMKKDRKKERMEKKTGKEGREGQKEGGRKKLTLNEWWSGKSIIFKVRNKSIGHYNYFVLFSILLEVLTSTYQIKYVIAIMKEVKDLKKESDCHVASCKISYMWDPKLSSQTTGTSKSKQVSQIKNVERFFMELVSWS